MYNFYWKRKFLNPFVFIFGNNTGQNILLKISEIIQYLQGYGSGDLTEYSGEGAVVSRIDRSKSKKLVIFDIGSNVGQFIELAKKNIKKNEFEIHSFEPLNDCSKILKKKYSKDHQVYLNKFALGEKKNKQTIFFDHKTSGSASLISFNPQNSEKMNYKQTVNTDTIDNYLSKNNITQIDLLKLDIEGSEFNALKGAKKAFSAAKIRSVLFEFGGQGISPRHFIYDFYNFFTKYHYDFYRLTPSGYLKKIKRYNSSDEVFKCTNYFAVLSEETILMNSRESYIVKNNLDNLSLFKKPLVSAWHKLNRFVFKLFLSNNKRKINFKIKKTKLDINKEFYLYDNSFFNKLLIQDFSTTERKIINRYNAIKKFYLQKKKKNFDIVVDVGANIGYWAHISSKIFIDAKYYCFEPLSKNYSILKKNLKNNKKFKSFKLALGEKNEFKHISFPEWINKFSELENTGLVSLLANTSVYSEKVKCKKFDDFNLKIPKNSNIFFKADVEGYEINVLKGLRKFIQSHKNIFFELELNLEISNYKNKNNFSEILNFFRGYGYKAYCIIKDDINCSHHDIILLNKKTISQFRDIKVLNLLFLN